MISIAEAANMAPAQFSAVNILIGAVGLLVTVCGFLLKMMINQLLKGNELLTKIDKKVDILTIRVDHNEKSIDKNEKLNDKQDLAIFEMRGKVESMSNKLSTHIEGEN